MKIIQLLPAIAYGDAIGNDTVAIKHALEKAGYKTEIRAEHIDNRLLKEVEKGIPAVDEVDAGNILIYHLSTGSELNYKIAEYPCKKILIYHNITPANYFYGYNHKAWWTTLQGERSLHYLADKVDYILADSSYNRKSLKETQFECKIDVLPILIPFSDYEKEPDTQIIERYGNDDYINILFIGRIAPNKKQEDIIKAFYLYQRKYNRKTRLFLVGRFEKYDTYYQKLEDYVRMLGAENVIFTGSIKFSEILAYYRVADLFLCMSEHEGFCVPLVEAMYFNIPIIAYNSSAIAETLGDAGILLNKKKPLETAALMNYLITHIELQEDLKKNQRRQLQKFDHDKVEHQLLKYIEEFINMQL